MFCPCHAVNCSSLCTAKVWRHFLIGTPGIRLKSLWTVWNQKFIWDIFKSSHLSSQGRVRGRQLLKYDLTGPFVCMWGCFCVSMHVCTVCVLLCMCLSLSVNMCFLMHHKVFSINMHWVDFLLSTLERATFPKAHYSFFFLGFQWTQFQHLHTLSGLV